MKYVRIKSYKKDKLVAEWLYRTDDQIEALDRARKDYPEHRKCVFVAQDINSNDPKWTEYIEACRRCGVIY